MSLALLRAVRIIVSPNEECQAIRHEETRARAIVARFVLERDAAEHVTLSTVLFMVSSLAMGALGSWLGLI